MEIAPLGPRDHPRLESLQQRRCLRIDAVDFGRHLRGLPKAFRFSRGLVEELLRKSASRRRQIDQKEPKLLIGRSIRERYAAFGKIMVKWSCGAISVHRRFRLSPGTAFPR